MPLYIYCIKLLSRRLWRICAAETRDEDGLPPLRPRKANGGSRRRRGCVEGCAAAARAASYAAARGAHAIASTPHRRPGTAGVEGAAAAPVLPARLHTARRRAQPVGGQKAAAPAWGGAIASAAAASGRACWHPRTPLPGPQQQHDSSGRTLDQNTRPRAMPSPAASGISPCNSAPRARAPRRIPARPEDPDFARRSCNRIHSVHLTPG